ncbi:MFS transporter [Candidatus Rhabdochlamydia porcellionis]|jgi:proton-dependent oligopeptide transporter, POT family|uniref:Dipeptide and tripeptide permease C n=1 Tax=Candidatus Rhabdochlamydia porcellionis TaxID=225148 RepID=A0ABX8YZS0_9BACT|nr:MFS transporter [Candidatus Rhabdochlamydia porcellionis]QZA58900.1 Dipeptide and tripeptide permease C [Candidatus Rhabdochlamydia porcellionis]
MKYIGSSQQPTALYYIALTEICRRIAFGAIAYLFFLYIADFQYFTEHASSQIGTVFLLITIFLPILGGFIVERIQYRLSVIWGVLLNVVGCFLILTSSLPFLFIALVLVAFGNALFQPGSYALLGTFYQQRPHLRDSGFSIYYALISLGPLLAFWILNSLADLKNLQAAFAIAGSIGLMGLIPLSIALKQYNRLKLQAAENAFSPLHKQEKDRIWVTVILILFSIIFWIAQDLSHMTLNPLLIEYSPNIARSLPFDMQLFSIQSLYLILIALALAKIYLFSYKKRSYSNAILKISLAFFILSICFAMLTLDSFELNFGSYITSSVFTIYFFVVLAELLLAPIGLSLITRLSPRRYTAVLIGIWITCFNAAFYLRDLAFLFIPSPISSHMLFKATAIALIIIGLLVFALSKKLNRLCHFELF